MKFQTVPHMERIGQMKEEMQMAQKKMVMPQYGIVKQPWKKYMEQAQGGISDNLN